MHAPKCPLLDREFDNAAWGTAIYGAEAAGPSVDRPPTEPAESDHFFFQCHFYDSQIVDKKWTAKCKLCSKNVSAMEKKKKHKCAPW